MKLSIIVPVFNEGKSISEILTKLMAVYIKPFDVEIIVVDDGSTDETKKKLSLYKTENINVLIHDKNLGKENAVIPILKPFDVEIIVVDDGSTDETKKKLSLYKTENINVLIHDKNLGKGSAVRTGIKTATGDYVLIQDA